MFPLSRLLPGAFIVGLEQDLTSPDRDHPVASLLSNFLGV
ncbi:MAG: hypothetical protein BAJATHORv1_20565 [Candidatus Thorarchaeota archaeon]|nr:MAG: hypothetical protein BAJATHORv1_20565 [Candidatus Thorarchaeota archaeon]